MCEFSEFFPNALRIFFSIEFFWVDWVQSCLKQHDLSKAFKPKCSVCGVLSLLDNL